MTPLDKRLIRIGRWLLQWKAVRVAAIGGAVCLLCLTLVAAADMIVRFDRPGRLIGAAFVFGGLAILLGVVGRILRRWYPPVAVSAALERAFPFLDNRLINYWFFAQKPEKGAFERAYLATPPPALEALDLRALRNVRAERRAFAAFLGALLMLLLPGLWAGPAWTNSLLRILNPLSSRPPTMLARILEVAPGSVTRLQGSSIVLECRVEGKRGQPVLLELEPAGGRKITLRLGELEENGGVQLFSHVLESLTTETRYRFRAGDDRSPFHALTPRPPLAFQKVWARIVPPAYTGLEPRDVEDALSGEPLAPEGSEIEVIARCNYPLASVIVSQQVETVRLTIGPEPAVARGRCRIQAGGHGLALLATDVEGLSAVAALPWVWVPDRPPRLQVLSPLGPVVLAPGASPHIQWTATDDYGFDRAVLEQFVETQAATVRVEVAAWTNRTGREWTGEWKGESPPPTSALPSLVFRLTVWDNRSPDPQPAISPLLVFQRESLMTALAEEQTRGEQVLTTLDRLIRLQQENLDRTEPIAARPSEARPGQWEEAAQVQQTIRGMAGQLLADPRKPLGALHTAVARLWEQEMAEAPTLFARIPDLREQDQIALAARAVALERKILETLTRVNLGLPRVQQHQQISDLLSLLDALVKHQQQVREATALLPEDRPAPSTLVDRQDGLASQLTEFMDACEREARTVERGDARFAALLREVAAEARSCQIAADMIRAAEALESGDRAQALSLQDRILAALRKLQERLTAWRVEEAEKKAEILLDAMTEAKARLEKLRDLQSRIVEAMREVASQPDKSDKAYDELMEEVSAVKSNMAEAVLQIANDLHIFPELPVGNDLVEDVFQIYEEMKQVPGSEEDKAAELGLQKEDWILELLEKAEGRIDDMEMWLAARPDALARHTENFDQAELPKIPVLPMPSELEDLIGDLLAQAEEEKAKADDSATNQGSADMPAGWDVMEGEFANFSAKGKSGNEAPDHKEQDGRSLVGRQGMSDGETTAGSGKINEGDPNMEARRTRDSPQGGQVQEEDHAEAKATGGGKSAGYAEEEGMAGAGPRRDAPMEGSDLGILAQMKRDAEALYAKASLLHVRTIGLDQAVEALGRAHEALVNNRIQQVREYQRVAVAALRRARAQLDAGLSAESLPADTVARAPSERVAGLADEAPDEFRELVSNYFKSLAETP